MSSVVSVRSSGWNQPFSGHFNSQSTKPSLLGRCIRFSRYSPHSIRSTANFCPGLMPSCCRISAGRTTCPLLDTVVVMRGKILSYPASVKPGVIEDHAFETSASSQGQRSEGRGQKTDGKDEHRTLNIELPTLNPRFSRFPFDVGCWTFVFSAFCPSAFRFCFTRCTSNLTSYGGKGTLET
jgi:hypothetical protein